VGAVLVLTGTVAAIGILVRKLVSPSRRRVDPQWLSGFSLERYRPLERVLGEEDYRFLASQKGFHRSMARRLRRERSVIFRRYLACLRKDFASLEAATMLCMAASRHDRPELAKALLRRKAAFILALLAVEWRFAMFRLGFGNVDASVLVNALEGMRAQLGHAALARQATA